MAFVQTKDGTSLFMNDWGQGRPIVLVHGWPLNADMWEYSSTYLASQGFRVVTYDRRGFGRSSQPWSGYDYDTLADDLAAVMDHLDLHDAVLVGFSMGGGEVARYLARHGMARVSKAVLVAAVTPYLLKDASNPHGVDAKVFEQMIEGIETDRPGFLAPFGKAFFGAGLLNFSVSSEILQWAQGMALQGSMRATLECARAFSSTDFRADLPKITVPTLVIHGDADATVPIEASARQAIKLLPHGRLVEYSGAPHALMYTERDRLNADLIAFARD